MEKVIREFGEIKVSFYGAIATIDKGIRITINNDSDGPKWITYHGFCPEKTQRELKKLLTPLPSSLSSSEIFVRRDWKGEILELMFVSEKGVYLYYPKEDKVQPLIEQDRVIGW